MFFKSYEDTQICLFFFSDSAQVILKGIWGGVDVCLLVVKKEVDSFCVLCRF